MPESSDTEQPRRLSLLVTLLLALHVLFGFTAIMGMLIAHATLNSTHGTAYHSQLRWLIVTFWMAFAAYTIAFWGWYTKGMLWPVIATAAWVAYRLLVNLFYWKNHQPLTRHW